MRSKREWVESFANPALRLDAMRALLGSVNSRELRDLTVTDETLHALVEGLQHANPQVRWWCIQLLDHCSDPRAIDAIVPLLDDPVPRVRRNAAHALGCTTCKPAWSGELGSPAVRRLREMARTDPNRKVREEAFRSLAVCTGAPHRSSSTAG